MSNRFHTRVHNALQELSDRDLQEVQELLVDMDLEIDVLTAENESLKGRLSKIEFGDF